MWVVLNFVVGDMECSDPGHVSPGSPEGFLTSMWRVAVAHLGYVDREAMRRPHLYCPDAYVP